MRLTLRPLLIALIILAPLGGGATPIESVLYAFPGGTAGVDPSGILTADANGTLYGTTALGGIGSPGHGTVFALTKGASGWSESVLYSFTGAKDGNIPAGGVITDTSGALYGTTQTGGSAAFTPNGAGVVFKLTPPHPGVQAWTETVLVAFKGADGAYPNSGLSSDGAGGFYGTTIGGGHFGAGTVFHVTPPLPGAKRWRIDVLHSFTNVDGSEPFGNLMVDAHGTMYGTAASGGRNNAGVAFSLTRATGARWRYQIMYEFNGGVDGGNPFAGLTEDAGGNFYGTTNTGGIIPCTNGESAGCGVVFELSPQGNGSWLETVIFAFQPTGTGAVPGQGTLVSDASGTLYGATTFGGESFPANGVVYKLTRAGSAWKETVLHDFQGSPDGSAPGGSLLIMPSGTLLGTTAGGGSAMDGTVFELKR